MPVNEPSLGSSGDAQERGETLGGGEPRHHSWYSPARQQARQTYIRGAAIQASALLTVAAMAADVDDMTATIGEALHLLEKAQSEILQADLR